MRHHFAPRPRAWGDIGARARRAALGLAAALLLAAAAAPGAAAQDRYRLSTGAPDGVYQKVGEAVRDVLHGAGGRDDIAFDCLPSPGSVANVHRIERGDTELAIVQGDVLYFAVEGRRIFDKPFKSLRAITVLYPETIHIVARSGLGARAIGDLRGKRVALGETGSGTAASAVQILDAAGIGEGDIAASHASTREGTARLRAGEVDAIFVAAPASSTAIAALLAQGAALVPLDPVTIEKATRVDPFFQAREIAAFTYPGQEAAVPALCIDAVLATGADAPLRVVQEIASRLADGREKVAEALPPGVEVLPERASERLPVPLHKGAMQYLASRGAIERPLKVYCSLFLHDVWNFDVKTGMYEVDFEIWFKWRGRVSAENDRFDFEVMNGVMDSVEPAASEKTASTTSSNHRVRATLRDNFLLHNYPFDRQVLRVVIEHRSMQAQELAFLPDREYGDTQRNLLSQAIEPKLTISDWVISDVRQGTYEHRYPSDFGSLTKAGEGVSYSRYLFEIELRRVVLPYVIKFLVPLVIIVLMAFVCFFMHPEQFDAKVMTAITALLSSVAFHVSQADHLPEVGYLVAADKFFLVSYVVIFLTLVEITVENYYVHEERLDIAWRIMRLSQVVFPILFFGPLAYIILVIQAGG